MPQAESWRVLVVEEDAFTQITPATVVESLGHTVVGQAATVVEAMDRAHDARPRAALVDLDLGPVISGG